MFARATNTRMKGSSVFQGLRSWPWKIHQQLPLSVRESQRLLGALTNSFRQHLDEVHPPKAIDDHRPKATGEVGQTRLDLRALHSSAAAADKHLSSILTNPLLTRGVSTASRADQDYANAMMQLQKDSAQDPIALLEDYQEKGIATLLIADLCLRKFKESIETLESDAARKAVVETQAGRRTLLWLFRNGRHTKPEFIERHSFIEGLIACLMMEGQEQLLWDWLRLDVALDQDKRYENDGAIRMYHIYRWKGQVLRGMVNSKLGSPNKERKSADEALEVFSKACEIKRSASRDDPSNCYFPLGHAGGLLKRVLSSTPNDYSKTNHLAYERFIDTSNIRQDGNPMQAQIDAAMLWLHHPLKPTGRHFLSACRHLFSDRATKYELKLRLMMTDPRSVEKRQHWFMSMVHAAFLLENEGQHEDGLWLTELACELYPALARYVETDKVRFARQHDQRHGNARMSSDDSIQDGTTPRVPFPVFT